MLNGVLVNQAFLPTLGEEVRPRPRRSVFSISEDGFEAEVASLGAQKQLAGGGRYREGIGWAIGLDRLMFGRSILSE